MKLFLHIFCSMLRIKFFLILTAAILCLPPVYAQNQIRLTPQDKTPAEIFGYLEKAVELIQKKGEEAYLELTDPEGPWVSETWYLYINNFDGYNVAHLNKKMIGKYFFAIRDVKGNAFFAELQKAAMSEAGRGWVEFWWPKPGEKKPARKIGFVVRIPNKRLWIGTGAYDMTDEEIKRLSETLTQTDLKL